MSTDEIGWFSASDLSLLGERLIAGLPKTMSGCMRRAKKEDWASREVKGSGGPGGILTEYQPPAPVLALIHSFLDANPEFFMKSKTRTKADLASISKEVFGDAPDRIGRTLPPHAMEVLRREMAKPENQPPLMMRMAGVSTPEGKASAAQAIDESLLSACHAACRAVYGDKFDAESAVVQMGYATDLYGLLVRLCASNDKDLGEMKCLEVNGLIELLKTYVRLSWARKFPPLVPSLYSF